jgi:hypothetical protein
MNSLLARVAGLLQGAPSQVRGVVSSVSATQITVATARGRVDVPYQSGFIAGQVVMVEGGALRAVTEDVDEVFWV